MAAHETELLGDILNEHSQTVAALDRLDAYYNAGYYDNLDVPKAARENYIRLIESSVTNWLQLVVGTTAERLIVDGFRSGDETVDAQLWEWWQANGLDSRQMLLNTAASRNGVAYVSVWPSADGAAPKIAADTARSVALRYDDDDPTVIAAAVKYRPSAAWLYLPDKVVKFTRRKGATSEAWEADDEFDNPLEVVPFVPFKCNADLDGNYMSDLTPAIPILNRITETTVDRLLASRLSAFRQRYAIGLEIDFDEDGNPVAPFNAAADRLWVTDQPDVKFGEFGEATLSNYINAVEADVNHLAAVTRTPAHYLLGKMVNLSAEALAAAETGLARKVAERQQTFGEAWEDVMRLAQVADGVDEVADLETIWRNTETVSDAQRVDAAVKLSAIGVPQEALWERIGASPQEIGRWRRQARLDALRSSLRSPLVNDGAADLEQEDLVG